MVTQNQVEGDEQERNGGIKVQKDNNMYLHENGSSTTIETIGSIFASVGGQLAYQLSDNPDHIFAPTVRFSQYVKNLRLDKDIPMLTGCSCYRIIRASIEET